MLISPISIVIVAATVLGGAMAVPQAWKITRYRTTDGVSSAWSAISAVLNAWWCAYAIGIGDWAIFPVAAISVTAYLAIAAALVRHRPEPPAVTIRAMTAAAIVVGTVPLVVVLLGGWVVAGVVLGALYGVQLSPAVVAVYRSNDVSGVSMATWVLALAEAVLWGIYGVARVDLGVTALAITGSIASMLVIARLLARRTRSHRTVGYALAPA